MVDKIWAEGGDATGMGFFETKFVSKGKTNKQANEQTVEREMGTE